MENTFLGDNAQAADEQSQNGGEELEGGDIMPVDIMKRGRRRRKRGIIKTSREERLDRNAMTGSQWDYHVIPYKIIWDSLGGKKNYKPWIKAKIDYVMNFEYGHKLGDCITLCEIENCKKMKDKDPEFKYNDRNYVEVRFDKGGCWSGVGMYGGKQVLNIQFPSCMQTKGTIAHEFMHALGFYHEHARPDRDQYIVVVNYNVRSNRRNNFDKQTATKAYDHYDFNSVMQYGEFAFRDKEWGDLSAQFTRTILPSPLSLNSIYMQMTNWGRGVTFGQRVGLSFCDELKIRRFYSEPGIRGGKKCKLWTERTCCCLSFSGNKPEGWNENVCNNIECHHETNTASSLSGFSFWSIYLLVSCRYF